MSVRDRLDAMGRRRYDIELKRMQKAYGVDVGAQKTDIMASRWTRNLTAG